MADRRLPSSQVTPEYEDSGLFKKPPQNWTVDLVPRFQVNSRNDLLIKGFLDGESAIDVVFAGRRRPMVGPVVEILKSLWTRANVSAQRGGAAPKHDSVRLSVIVEGSWRPRFELDKEGWQTKDHQLYAARWHVSQNGGDTVTFGTEARVFNAFHARGRP